MNFYQAFDNIKNGISNVDTKKFSGNFAIQLTMTNKDCGGIFYIEYKDGKLNVEPYNYYDNNVSIVSGYSDLLKLLGGTLKLSSAKIEVFGDANVLSDFISAITFTTPATTKKAAPKKTAVKIAAKKETAKTNAKATKKVADVKKEVPKAEEKIEKKAPEAKKASKKTETKKTTKKA